jgi:hypothetical protein
VVDGVDHRQEWRDTDASGQEQVLLGLHQREVVAGTANPNQIALGEFAVDVVGSASAVGFAQHRDLQRRAVGGVTAQRVLAHQVIAQHELDVRARFPFRHGAAIGVAQGQPHDTGGEDVFAVELDLELHLGSGQGARRHQCLLSEQPRTAHDLWAMRDESRSLGFECRHGWRADRRR